MGQIGMPSEIWIPTQMFKLLLLEAALVWADQSFLPMVSLTGVLTTTRRRSKYVQRNKREGKKLLKSCKIVMSNYLLHDHLKKGAETNTL